MNSTAATTIRDANVAYLSLVRGEGDSISRFFSPDYTAHLTDSTITGGHDLVRSVAAKFASAFSGLSIEVEILVEGADRVAWQRVFRGTQTGAFYGFPASGREVVWRDMVTTHLQDELIAEEWVVSDLAERLLLSRKQS
jgi:predicted ester cyclase